MKKVIKKILLASALLVLGLSCGKKSHAAAKGVQLPCFDTVKKYDVTGDGKADSIKIYCETPDKYNEGIGKDWRIKVNNKIVYRQKYKFTDFLSVQFFKLSSNIIYFDVVERGDANDYNAGHLLFLVMNDKWKQVCNFHGKMEKSTNGWGYNASIIKITKNKMKVGFYCQFYGLGGLNWEVQYKLKNGIWKPEQSMYNVVGPKQKLKNMTVIRKFSLLKTAGGTKKAFTVKKGDKMKLGKICFKNNRTYVQFTFNGKKGWFKTPKKDDGKMYFKGVQYAG